MMLVMILLMNKSILKMSKDNNLVMPKKNEFIYFENKKVIKYFKDPTIAKFRFKRIKTLKNYMPKNINKVDNFLYYDFFEGKPLTRFRLGKVFDSVIDKLIKDFWKEKKLSKKQKFLLSKNVIIFIKIRPLVGLISL